MNAITLHPILPWPVLLLIVMIICALALWSFFKSPHGMWFRLSGTLLILASLFNPQITTKSTQALKDIAIVLIDRSSSQSIEERQKQTNQAVAFLQKETRLYQDLDIRYVEILPDGKEDKLGTRALSHLRHALSGIDPKRYAGSILISDGQIHDIDPYKDIPGPFHVLISGKKDDIDRRLETIDAPRYGLVGEPLTIQFRLLDNGQVNTTGHIRLIKPDGSIETIPLQKKDIQEFSFTPDHAGQSVLILESDLLKDEISTSNNRVALSINGVRDRLRVLLVSGQPHQGQRTWRNILRSDAAVDLVHFTILRPSEKEDFTPLQELSLIAFPVRELFEEKINDFDLVIFDRYYRRNVLSQSYFDNINKYVRNGGALLVSAGPDFSGPLSLAHTGLGNILPASPTGQIKQDRPFPILRSVTGLRHPITADLGGAEKQWGPWIRLIEAEANKGKTILTNDSNDPVLIVDRVEKGRVALLLSDHIWLWARGFQGGGPHNALVRHLVHWLMKEPDLEEEKLSLTILDNAQLEIKRQTLSDKIDPVRLIRPDGSEELITLKKGKYGLATAHVQAISPGIYHANDTKLKTLITVGALNPKEFHDPRASALPLQKIVEETGGSIHWISEELPPLKRISSKGSFNSKRSISLKRNHAEAIIGIKQSALFPAWALFIMGLGLWTLAWWRESR